MSGDKRDERETSGCSKKKAGRVGAGGLSNDVGRYQNEGQEGEVCSVRQGSGLVNGLGIKTLVWLEQVNRTTMASSRDVSTSPMIRARKVDRDRAGRLSVGKTRGCQG